MTLAVAKPDAVITDPRGREVEYRVVYETEVNGATDSPLYIEVGDLPNYLHRYRIRVEIEQLPNEAAS